MIELDGGQHLGDAEAYRRDRRKDAALQEHGYLVLRFLCEDLGKRLDDVLDTILRAIAHQSRLIGCLLLDGRSGDPDQVWIVCAAGILGEVPIV